MIAELVATVRAKIDAYVDAVQGKLASMVLNTRGDLSVAQGLPYRAEAVRMRNSYQVVAASGVAPVVAMPTTAAQLSLSNNETAVGKIYVIDALLLVVTASASAATPLSIAGMLNTGNNAAVANTLIPRGLAGQAYKGVGTAAVGTTVVDEGWFPFGSSVVGAASQLGTVFEVPIDGLIIVPPLGKFSLVALANTVTTITCKLGIRWHEVQLPIGQ